MLPETMQLEEDVSQGRWAQSKPSPGRLSGDHFRRRGWPQNLIQSTRASHLLFTCVIACSFGWSNSVHFVDVTTEVGITHSHRSTPASQYAIFARFHGHQDIVESMTGGVALLDFDKDGWLDIYFVNAPIVDTFTDPEILSHLYRNNRDGTFKDVTREANIGKPGWGMGACAGDYDGDGWLDPYVTCLGNNKLYANNGDGTFEEVAQRVGLDERRWSTGCTFGDYDNDGDLDLFVSNYLDFSLEDLPYFGEGRPCQYRGFLVHCGPRGLPGAGDGLYRNNGDGTFADVSRLAGVDDPARYYGMGAVWTDVNNDGFIDLFVANDSGPNYLYRNNQNGTFNEIGLLSGAALGQDGSEQASMGVALGDYDRDGRIDVFVTNFSEEYNALYRHTRGFSYTDMSFASQTAQSGVPHMGWGTEFFDYDNDGWLDLLVVNGHLYSNVDNCAEPKLLYHNNRNGTFSEVPSPSGSALMERRVSRGAAFGDLDNDGDIDVVVNQLDGKPMVLRNEHGNRGNWLRIKAEGRAKNSFALGARIKVVAGDLIQRSEIRSGASYLSQHDLRLHFGLGRRKSVDLVEVQWPGGGTTRREHIQANQEIRIGVED